MYTRVIVAADMPPRGAVSSQRIRYLLAVPVAAAFIFSFAMLMTNWTSPDFSSDGSGQVDQAEVDYTMQARSRSSTGSTNTLMSVLAAVGGDRQPVQPHHEQLSGAHVFWQMPTTHELTGLLILFHGCGHGGEDWFILPEERVIVRHALVNGFGVLAVSARGKCWQDMWPMDQNEDAQAVRRSVSAFVARERLEALPRFGIGVSSGGTFITIIARAMGFAAISVQISPGHWGALEAVPKAPQEAGVGAADDDLSTRRVAPGGAPYYGSSAITVDDNAPFPPVAFVYMVRDPWASEKAIRTSKSMLESKGVRVHVYRVDPAPLSPRRLSDRIESLTPADSRALYGIIKAEGFIDSKGMLRDDPRRSYVVERVLQRWMQQSETSGGSSTAGESGTAEAATDPAAAGVIPRARAGVKSTGAAARPQLAAALQEQMNMLYGQHELTSDHFTGIMDWFRTIALARAAAAPPSSGAV